jgi:hypothetical protein
MGYVSIRLLNIRIQTIKLGVSPPTNDIIGLDCHSIGHQHQHQTHNSRGEPITINDPAKVGVPHISHPDQLERTQNFLVRIRIQRH